MQTPHYEAGPVVLHHGDCKSVMAAMPDASVDAIVTDPPYELTAGKRGGSGQASVNLNSPYGRSRIGAGGFMGKHWDATGIAHDVEMWREAYRVLKPGGHLLAFGGSRTWHRLATAIEDAGFEMRDSIAWLYGSGFPKSLDVSKAIDKAGGASPADQAAVLVAARERAGLSREEVAEHVGCTPSSVADWERGRARAVGAAVEFVTPSSEYRAKLAALLGYTADERRVVGLTVDRRGDGTVVGLGHSGTVYSGPETTAAKAWEGWGTALKPSHEPVVVARKPADPTAILDTIGSQLGALEEACRRRVSGAARSSARTRADSSVARTATAPASAATQRGAGQGPTTATGAAASSSAATATSASEWTAERFLSTVTSWRECLAEISAATSTSTTSTATSRTTDLQTLSSCLSSIMQSVTEQSILDPRSWSSLATAADNLFAAGVLSSRSTLALSAIESATSATPEGSPPAAGSPAYEPIVVARKPLIGTVAANVLAFGTGALNIDATRTAGDNPSVARRQGSTKHLQQRSAKESEAAGKIESRTTPERYREERAGELLGRWPTNVVLDESQAAVLDAQSGHQRDGVAVNRNRGSVRPQTVAGSPTTIVDKSDVTYGGGGGASRFFPTFKYEAKAPTSERPVVDGVAHATVKPLALMRWLVRLVTPPGGVVLDPFAGSGTTLEAAVLEGFDSIGIELEEAHLPLIKSRFKKPFDQYLDLGDIA